MKATIDLLAATLATAILPLGSFSVQTIFPLPSDKVLCHAFPGVAHFF